MGAGTKVNSKKEKAVGFDYLGTVAFRFYQRCTTCSTQFTFRTDPQHACYVPESGITASFNPQLEAALQVDDEPPKTPFCALERLETTLAKSKRAMDADEQVADLIERSRVRERLVARTVASSQSHEAQEERLFEEDSRLLFAAASTKCRRIVD